MVIIPFLVLFSVEVVMTGVDCVGRDVGVEMVDVVVFDSVGEGAEEEGDLQESTALESCTREVPIFLAFSIGQVDRVLEMEQNGSQNLSKDDGQPHIQSRDSDQRKHPSKHYDRHQLLQKGEAEEAIPFRHCKRQAYKPHQWRGKEEEYNRLPQDPDSNFLKPPHFLVLFLGKENGLREIQPIQVPEMLMMMVMSIPPRVEWEVCVHAYQFPEEDVGLDGFEEGEVSHVVKLYEESNVVERMDGPTHDAESEMDQRDCQKLIGEGNGDGHHCLTIIWTAIRLHVLFYF